MTSKYRCLIVDDEALARELIESHLSNLPQFDIIASCASAIEASQVINNHTIDLMFLDIEMPVLSGTEFYKNLLNKPKVIFTTAYRDYAVDGFELDAVDYLLKPIVFARFFQAIEKFLGAQTIERSAQLPESTPEHIFVRADRKHVKIVLSDILYVKGMKDYVKIYCDDNSYITKSTLTEFKARLNNSFLQIHRSFIVNKGRVTAFTRHDVEINELELPIGEKYRVNLEIETNNG